MAIGVQNYPNINPVGATWPYGHVKDDPDGTPVNELTWGDYTQFFACILNNAGLTPNGIPENSANGFEYVQALNTLINAQTSAWSESLNAGAGTFLPVILSGCVITAGTGVLTISEGWFFYNGKLTYCVASGASTGISGQQPFISLGNQDALPTGIAASFPNSFPTDAAQFKFTEFKTLNSQNHVNIFSANITLLQTYVALLQSNVNTLQSDTGLEGWTLFTTVGNWGAGTEPPKYRRSGLGQIFMQGKFQTTAVGVSTLINNLPTGYRPLVNKTYAVSAYNAGSSVFYTAHITITSTGDIVYETVSTLPTATNSYLDITAISFFLV